MHRNTWKNRERQVAKAFGTQRTALSGGNSHITHSDTLHPSLYIEHKARERWALFSLFRKVKAYAKHENKLPIITLSEMGKPGFLIVVHSDDLDKFVEVQHDQLA